MTTLAAAGAASLGRAGLLPAAAELCRSIGFGGLSLVPFADGSLPVYALGAELVLKLYPPDDLPEAGTELAALRAVQGRLPVRTPEVELAGTHHGWGYLVMRRLPGRGLAEVWPALSTADRDRLAGELGEILATLHALPVPAGLEWSHWPDFLARRREEVVPRQRALGLDEHWLGQIPGFLDRVPLERERTVLLHTEFSREHLLLAERDGRWSVSGLFDFEPAMRGAAEYEFAAAGVFLTAADRRFLRTLLLGYGYQPDQLGPDLSRRLLAYTVLHRYAHLDEYLRRLPAPAEPTLDALARTWFAT